MRVLNSMRTASLPAATCWSAVGLAETITAWARAGGAPPTASPAAIAAATKFPIYFRILDFPHGRPLGFLAELTSLVIAAMHRPRCQKRPRGRHPARRPGW